ncbi:MAG: AI-2E family transporter [Patescibacteria group bacterium]|nr:AI-2E family transporter [Patescibacteria group bacterium]
MADSSRELNIRINTGTIIRAVIVVILILALWYMFDIVLVVLASVIIASAIEPVIRRLKRKGVHRIISVILVFIVLAAVLAGIIIFIVPLVTQDAIGFLNSLPKNISLEDIWSPMSSAGVSLGTGMGQSIASRTVSLSDLISGLQQLIVGTSAGVFQTASVLFGGLFSFVLIVVLSFYLAVQEEGVADFLRIIAPVKHHEYITNLWARSQRKIALWLQGQIILGILIGVLVYLVLMVVGIPHAILLAIFAGLFEIIPVFGPIISSVPAILIAFADKGVGTGLLLIGLYIIIYQFESQLFYPLVVKKIVGISPIVVILALVIGGKLAGLLGALIAVPLSAALMEYISDIEKYKKQEIAERATANKSI